MVSDISDFAKFMIKLVEEPVIIEDGSWSTVDQIFEDYKVPEGEQPFCKILLGYYLYECYSGESFVLYFDSRDNQLYEVNGSHCSCYGLEDQWKPEVVDLDNLIHRLDNGSFGLDYDEKNKYAKELREVITKIQSMV